MPKLKITELCGRGYVDAAPQTVRYWVREKGLPATPSMNGYIVDTEDLRKWLAENTDWLRSERWSK